MKEYIGITALALLIIASIAALIWFSMESSKEWQQFVADHECVVVERISGTSHTGNVITFDSKGQPHVGMVSTYKPGKTAWKCNDGVTYWR